MSKQLIAWCDGVQILSSGDLLEAHEPHTVQGVERTFSFDGEPPVLLDLCADCNDNMRGAEIRAALHEKGIRIDTKHRKDKTPKTQDLAPPPPLAAPVAVAAPVIQTAPAPALEMVYDTEPVIAPRILGPISDDNPLKTALQMWVRGVRMGRNTVGPRDRQCIWCPMDFTQPGFVPHVQIHGFGDLTAAWGTVCPICGSHQGSMGVHAAKGHGPGWNASTLFVWARDHDDPHGVYAERRAAGRWVVDLISPGPAAPQLAAVQEKLPDGTRKLGYIAPDNPLRGALVAWEGGGRVGVPTEQYRSRKCLWCPLHLTLSGFKKHVNIHGFKNTGHAYGDRCPACGDRVDGLMGVHAKEHNPVWNLTDLFIWARDNGDPHGIAARRRAAGIHVVDLAAS